MSWMRVEVGYTRHRKFLVLNANAFSLWHEMKDYCEDHLTDGIFPKEALKTFRFFSGKALKQLMVSAGPKPSGTASYAPLVERHDLGYKLHDYLEWNECRERALARIARAKEDRQETRDRQTEFRDRRRAERNALRNADRNADRNGQNDGLVTPEKQPRNAPTAATATAASAAASVLDLRKQDPVSVLDTHEDADRNYERRAAAFVALYAELFAEYRHGARYHSKPSVDFQRALELVHTFDDARLARLAKMFLRYEHDDWINQSNRSLAVFASRASWCDDRLGEAERRGQPA